MLPVIPAGNAARACPQQTGNDPRSMPPPRCLKSSCFLVKTSTAAVCQRLLLLLTKQRWDFSREAMDSEFVKLLSPALKPEREVEINICIFILPLQFPSGVSPRPCLYLVALLGELHIIYKFPAISREVVGISGAELMDFGGNF